MFLKQEKLSLSLGLPESEIWTPALQSGIIFTVQLSHGQTPWV